MSAATPLPQWLGALREGGACLAPGGVLHGSPLVLGFGTGRAFAAAARQHGLGAVTTLLRGLLPEEGLQPDGWRAGAEASVAGEPTQASSSAARAADGDVEGGQLGSPRGSEVRSASATARDTVPVSFSSCRRHTAHGPHEAAVQGVLHRLQAARAGAQGTRWARVGCRGGTEGHVRALRAACPTVPAASPPAPPHASGGASLLLV